MFGSRKNQTAPVGHLPAVPAAWPVAVSPLTRAVEAFRHGRTGIEIGTPANAPPTFWPHDADPTDAGQPGKSAK